VSGKLTCFENNRCTTQAMTAVLHFIVCTAFCANIQVASSSEWSETRLIQNERVNEIAIGALSYASVALACGDSQGVKALKERLIAILRLASKKSSLTSDGRKTLENPDHFISMGAGIFKAKPYINCSQGLQVKRQVLEMSDALLGANR
jgi:hypothetical protein